MVQVVVVKLVLLSGQAKSMRRITAFKEPARRCWPGQTLHSGCWHAQPMFHWQTEHSSSCAATSASERISALNGLTVLPRTRCSPRIISAVGEIAGWNENARRLAGGLAAVRKRWGNVLGIRGERKVSGFVRCRRNLRVIHNHRRSLILASPGPVVRRRGH